MKQFEPIKIDVSFVKDYVEQLKELLNKEEKRIEKLIKSAYMQGFKDGIKKPKQQ